ncbi:protein LYK2 [Mercurialis annua]|uniref:protein LYK2 n=1 Tax=Mercurialis annua TaxID=3986 RepID=UPI00215DDF34|nr:protein LYK2 [Mercurialis annua]
MPTTMSHYFCFRALALLLCLLAPAIGQNLSSCETTSPDASGYRCENNNNASETHCKTFAILFTNSYFSSLSNLSFYLGFKRFLIAEANGFSADTEFLPINQPLLLPIDCKCNGSFFQADVTKITIKTESFYGIAESLQGLTTCRAIQERNLGVSQWNLADKARLLVPLRCACSSSTRFLVTYPVRPGDTVLNLAVKFNTSVEAIISENSRLLINFKPESLAPLTSLLIPLNSEPALGPLAKPHEPNSRFHGSSIPELNPHKKKKKSKMWMTGIYIAVTGVVVGATIAIVAAFFIIQLKKKQQQQRSSSKDRDPELQQLSLSIRTTSEKKVSFEQEPFDAPIIFDSTTTPRKRKVLVEYFSVEELRKATEDFSSSNLIDGSVYHGRLNGKNMAIKRIKSVTMSKINFNLLNNATQNHPNIIRVLGTCLSEDPDSFLVFEYAKNGSLKDWLHGGLAMKNQFIASCDCFLTWKQRLKICLDVAVALQYMHQIMNPSYVHKNVKSRNIFLDEEFNAKIGNFGMENCTEDDDDQGLVSPSIDIFAFGVVLIEVLSGKTPARHDKIKSILSSEDVDELREWMDKAMGENYSFDEAVTLANLAHSCVEKEVHLRPNAGVIVEELSRLVEHSSEGEHISICESSSKPLVKKEAAVEAVL